MTAAVAMGGVFLAEGGGSAVEPYPHPVNRQLERDFALMAYAETLKIRTYAAAVEKNNELPVLRNESPRTNDSAQWVAFVIGYREQMGNRQWEAHFVNDVLPCEGSVWAGYYGPPVSTFISRAQFDPGSWATTIRVLGPLNPDSPFDVGKAVAWWSNNIRHPGGSGGWPSCWWEGIVP